MFEGPEKIAWLKGDEKEPRGSLNMTLWLYPSQSRLDLIQLWQIGLPSSHLIRLLRQVRQPVLVRFLVLVFLRFASSFPPSFCCEELPWGSAKAAFAVVTDCSSMMQYFSSRKSWILHSNSDSDFVPSFSCNKRPDAG